MSSDCALEMPELAHVINELQDPSHQKSSAAQEDRSTSVTEESSAAQEDRRNEKDRITAVTQDHAGIPPVQKLTSRQMLENWINQSTSSVSIKKTVMEISSHITADFWISHANGEKICTLLHDIATSFDENTPSFLRVRLSRVLLGLRNTGKTTLMKTLKGAVEAWAKDRVFVVWLDGRALADGDRDILAEIEATCKLDKHYDIISALNTLREKNKCLLVIVDEAQDLYLKATHAGALDEKTRTAIYSRCRRIVLQLAQISEQVGSVGWLTGSSQALFSLYTQGEHKDYYGSYAILNDKKYRALFWTGARDAQSIQNLHREVLKEEITVETAAELFAQYGGAVGDLLRREPIPADVS